MKQWCVNFITIYYFDSITFDKLVQIYPPCFVYYNHEYSSKIKKNPDPTLTQKSLSYYKPTQQLVSIMMIHVYCPSLKTTIPKLEVSGSDQAINSTLYRNNDI